MRSIVPKSVGWETGRRSSHLARPAAGTWESNLPMTARLYRQFDSRNRAARIIVLYPTDFFVIERQSPCVMRHIYSTIIQLRAKSGGPPASSVFTSLSQEKQP
jgi:hypothetical protein